MNKKYYCEADVLAGALEKSIPEPNSGCWLWLGATGPFGHGRFHHPFRKKGLQAHRFIYESLRGEIPSDLIACHKCDNPACVNPDHIFIGTQADNMADMRRKGRGSEPPRKDWPAVMRHTAHHWQKLTIDQVVEIKKRLAAGERQHIIAADYGVARNTIGNIAQGIRWAHVA